MLRFRLPRHQLRRPAFALLAATAFAVTTPVFAEDGWTTEWKNGTRIESADGDIKLKIGGRIHLDFAHPDEDDAFAALDLKSESKIRRARLTISGTLYGKTEFKLDYDFTEGETTPKDVYVGLVDLPGVGGIRVGHFKEPFGLEESTSSNSIPFLERAMSNEAVNPVRNVGVMLHNSVLGDRMSWSLGAFQDSDGFARTDDGEWSFTGRITGAPLVGDDGGPVVHLGLAASKRSPTDNRYRLRSRAQTSFGPRLIDTGSFDTDSVDLLGLETALVQGPFWAAAEYMQADVGGVTNGTAQGFNVRAGWFLTGESRPYKSSQGIFDRVKPKAIFGKDGGTGAWEIAVRYTDLDLNDGSLSGGTQDGFTVGVNWYVNSASRVMLNYASADVEGAGTVDYAMFRFQVDF